MLVRIFAAVAVTLLFGAVILPGALAQDFTTSQNRQIDLHPRNDFPINQEVNLANTSARAAGATPDLEKDSLAFPSSEVGKFYGPYVRSSQFQFTYSRGGIFLFNATYNFTKAQIMNGVSTFWIRWPVDPSLYDQFCIRIGNYFKLGHISGSPIVDSDQYQRCTNNGASTSASQLIGCSSCPGRIALSPSLGDDTVLTSSGIYTKEWAWLTPNRNYTFGFVGHLRSDTPPSVWVTIERYQTNNTTNYQVFNYLTGVQHTETLALYPAFAFLFMSGVGIGGLTSYLVPFSNTTGTYVTELAGQGPIRCGDHISIYLPFFGADQVAFRIRVILRSSALTLSGQELLTQEWNTTAQNFLLTSSPYSYGEMWSFDPGFNGCSDTSLPGYACVTLDNGSFTVCSSYEPFFVFISADRPVHLLGAVPVEPKLVDSAITIDTGSTNVKWRMDLNGGTGAWGVRYDFSFPAPYTIAPTSHHVVPLFGQASWTTGRWANVTPGEYYTIYDFGWGRAYLFPGQVNLTMFLNNGTAIGFDSIGTVVTGTAAQQCQGLINITSVSQSPVSALQPVAEWVNELACFVLGLVGNIIGIIVNVFNTIWDTLVSLGNWIYNTLVGIAQFVWNVIMAIVDAAVQTALALLTALPFIIVLFIAARGLPDLAEAKRAFSGKVRGSFKRGLTKGREAKIRYRERATERLERGK